MQEKKIRGITIELENESNLITEIKKFKGESTNMSKLNYKNVLEKQIEILTSKQQCLEDFYPNDNKLILQISEQIMNLVKTLNELNQVKHIDVVHITEEKETLITNNNNTKSYLKDELKVASEPLREFLKHYFDIGFEVVVEADRIKLVKEETAIEFL